MAAHEYDNERLHKRAATLRRKKQQRQSIGNIIKLIAVFGVCVGLYLAYSSHQAMKAAAEAQALHLKQETEARETAEKRAEEEARKAAQKARKIAEETRQKEYAWRAEQKRLEEEKQRQKIEETVRLANERRLAKEAEEKRIREAEEDKLRWHANADALLFPLDFAWSECVITEKDIEEFVDITMPSKLWQQLADAQKTDAVAFFNLLRIHALKTKNDPKWKIAYTSDNLPSEEIQKELLAILMKIRFWLQVRITKRIPKQGKLCIVVPDSAKGIDELEGVFSTKSAKTEIKTIPLSLQTIHNGQKFPIFLMSDTMRRNAIKKWKRNSNRMNFDAYVDWLKSAVRHEEDEERMVASKKEHAEQMKEITEEDDATNSDQVRGQVILGMKATVISVCGNFKWGKNANSSGEVIQGTVYYNLPEGSIKGKNLMLIFNGIDSKGKFVEKFQMTAEPHYYRESDSIYYNDNDRDDYDCECLTPHSNPVGKPCPFCRCSRQNYLFNENVSLNPKIKKLHLVNVLYDGQKVQFSTGWAGNTLMKSFLKIPVHKCLIIKRRRRSRY